MMKWVLSVGVVGFTVAAIACVRAQTPQPSSPVLTPFELGKNSFRYKGQSGILDTQTVYWGGNAYLSGQKVGRFPGGGLRLARMIDEHTAIYDILTLQEGGPTPDGELAVFLPDSVTPDPLRVWRVLFEGVLKGTNGMGAAIQIPAVRFEEYAEKPESRPDADNLHPQKNAGTASTRQLSTGDDDVLKVAEYRQKCGGGDTQACINLATMYRMGWGVVKDQSEANSLYKKACDAGSDDACSHFDPAIPPPASPAPATSRIGRKQPATVMPKPTSDPPSPQLPN